MLLVHPHLYDARTGVCAELGLGKKEDEGKASYIRVTRPDGQLTYTATRLTTDQTRDIRKEVAGAGRRSRVTER